MIKKPPQPTNKSLLPKGVEVPKAMAPKDSKLVGKVQRVGKKKK
jgi:hypothetical protein